MQVKAKDIRRWTQALRSGKYEQSVNVLQSNTGFCCLGVACKLFIPKDKQTLAGETLVGKMPEHQSFAPEWLKQINFDFAARIRQSLSQMNDGFFFDLDAIPATSIQALNFDEIADLLELVYIHKALD